LSEPLPAPVEAVPRQVHNRQETLAQLGILVVAVVLGMSPWFSATVVAGAMVAAWNAPPATGIWLTLGVQLGFVLGSVVSATLLLADRWRPARLAMWSAALAAVATATLAVPGLSVMGALLLRIVVGAALAGVYPPGIKLAAGWTNRSRGAAIGALVGGTTLGSAVPHLLSLTVPQSEWRLLVTLAAVCAALAALLFGTVVREGPHVGASVPFDPSALWQVARNRGARLATLGYLGHMWELYAMWSTIGVFWQEAASRHDAAAWFAPLVAFCTVAAGAVGCVVAGRAGDRLGRSVVTIACMAASGSCALAMGPSLAGPLALTMAISLIWGATVVADSAQFSAAVTEFSDARYVGTAVTLQTALGFLLTMVTIRLVPSWSAWWGWERAYLPLAIGPALGIVAMWRLNTLERARRSLLHPG